MSGPSGEDVEVTPANDNAKPCPICKKLAVVKFRPFCSNRCANVDLNRWLTGAYAIPVVEEDEGMEDGMRE